MWFQALFGMIIALGFAAGEAASPRCFDFSKKVQNPLRRVFDLSSKEFETTSGKIEQTDRHWGAVHARVKKPTAQLLALILDHENTKSQSVDEFSVREVAAGPHFTRHEVTFIVKPFPFVTVEWVEDWAYTLLKGTAKAPSEILASYEKVQGTSHIEHLCGYISLKWLSQAATDVILYEEAKATNQSIEGTVQGLLDTLGKMKEKSP